MLYLVLLETWKSAEIAVDRGRHKTNSLASFVSRTVTVNSHAY